MTLKFAYNTNGATSHRLEDALVLMAEHGYAGVALTLDHPHFDPFVLDWEHQAERLRDQLTFLTFGSVIETGARFLLDPRQKHEPTLVTADPAGRMRRVGFLHRAIDVAAILGSECVSFWAGALKPGVERHEAWDWLRAGVEQTVAYAARRGVAVALEPGPGMLVETLDDYVKLKREFESLRLAFDIGHVLVTGEREPVAALHEYAAHLGTVSIEDMKRGQHVHLPFGNGDLDVPGVLEALQAIGFTGLVCVELSRDSHRADVMIPQAFSYLSWCRADARARREPGSGRAASAT